MFRLAPVPTMRRNVTIRVPDPEVASKTIAHTMTITYRVMSTKEMAEFDARRRTLTFDEQSSDPHALVREIVVGWGDIVDESGASVPFSPEALDRALSLPWFGPAVRDEYLRGLAGEPRLGN